MVGWVGKQAGGAKLGKVFALLPLCSAAAVTKAVTQAAELQSGKGGEASTSLPACPPAPQGRTEHVVRDRSGRVQGREYLHGMGEEEAEGFDAAWEQHAVRGGLGGAGAWGGAGAHAPRLPAAGQRLSPGVTVEEYESEEEEPVPQQAQQAQQAQRPDLSQSPPSAPGASMRAAVEQQPILAHQEGGAGGHLRRERSGGGSGSGSEPGPRYAGHGVCCLPAFNLHSRHQFHAQ